VYDHTTYVCPVHAVAWKAKERTAAFEVPAVHRERHRPEGSPVNNGYCSEQRELGSAGGRLWLLYTTAMSEWVSDHKGAIIIIKLLIIIIMMRTYNFLITRPQSSNHNIASSILIPGIFSMPHDSLQLLSEYR